MAPDLQRAVWRPAHTSNYTAANRPGSNRITRIVIHVAQGSWGGTVNWFQDPAADASAHYVVRSSDGMIAQCLRERNIGWHAGHWTYNRASIGIEHEGYIHNYRWFTAAMYRSSAALTARLCKKYGLPAKRRFIMSHSEVPGCSYSGGGYGCHVDPGRHWDWRRYMRLVRHFRSRI